jgi:hypothetical protein
MSLPFVDGAPGRVESPFGPGARQGRVRERKKNRELLTYFEGSRESAALAHESPAAAAFWYHWRAWA